jgi:hypothetical protein
MHIFQGLAGLLHQKKRSEACTSLLLISNSKPVLNLTGDICPWLAYLNAFSQAGF